MKRLGPALAATLRASTLDAVRPIGRHDAIVIGAGAAGGMAALSLTQAGLRVLVLDAGPARRSIRSRARQMTFDAGRKLLGPIAPRVLDLLLRSKVFARRQQVQSRCYAWGLAPDEFVDDLDCPYVTEPGRAFLWMRSRQLGGRIVIPGHGRQYYRFGSDDFFPKDGLSPRWPLEVGELDPWYASVERRVGIAGKRDNLPWLPDSELGNVREPTPAQVLLQELISARWPGARPILGRSAAPFDFLEAAAETGRLSVRSGAIVREIEVDGSGKVCGVAWIEEQGLTEERVSAPLVFLCASALESTRLLLLSRSARSPNGLGASSGVLGRYLMDHIFVQVSGIAPKLLPQQPSSESHSLYLPRFDARNFPAPSLGRGFGVQVTQRPSRDGAANFTAASFGEMLPRRENWVALDPTKRDAWGIPALRIDCHHGPVDLNRAREQLLALKELADVAGVTLTQIDETPRPPGTAIHECGTARMGSDPGESVVDPHNECWDARGLYVTDAACFPSQGIQNPLLTILALTARACDHAIRIARYG